MSPLATAYVKMWTAYQRLAIAYSATTRRLEGDVAALQEEVKSLRRIAPRPQQGNQEDGPR